MTAKVKMNNHPPVQRKLNLMRQRERSTNSFRNLLGKISMSRTK
jgi:uracil phosphoribosyltransferase